jgi:hypothetical protein
VQPDAPKLSAKEELVSLTACAQAVLRGSRKIALLRDQRFEGKVAEATALCRGGHQALLFRDTPWVDWSHYWGTGDMTSLPSGFINNHLLNPGGVIGALWDLEFQRIELLKFNLFDNSGTYQSFISGRGGVGGPALKTWPEMRLAPGNPHYNDVGGAGRQVCKGDLIRWRTVDGICNDLLNPLMGSAGTQFARNVEFEASFPEMGLNELARNRHGGRLALLEPDPQVISRKLFTRFQSDPNACANGYGLPNDSPLANCDYQKAPFFNVLAAYWIQFMTHDWFSHLEEGHNAPEYMKVGCETQLVNGVEKPLTPEQAAQLGCRPDDRIDKGYVAQDAPPGTFKQGSRTYMMRAPKTMANTNTAWWDASQLYGFNDRSRQRVKRDPHDRARLLLEPVERQSGGYLPVFAVTDPINAEWVGQEATAFLDNWTVGLSFLHNLFAREHNSFVAEFERVAAQTPDQIAGYVILRILNRSFATKT